MPIFEYRCLKCQKDFELIVDNSTIPTCPTCKESTHLHKQLSVFAINNGQSQGACPAESGEACPLPVNPGHSCCGGCMH